MKINTIVFDMGGVLLDFGAELFSRRLHVGAEGEALLMQHLLCTTDWVRLDRGTITEEEVYVHASARLPAELTPRRSTSSTIGTSRSYPSRDGGRGA